MKRAPHPAGWHQILRQPAQTIWIARQIAILTPDTPGMRRRAAIASAIAVVRKSATGWSHAGYRRADAGQQWRRPSSSATAYLSPSTLIGSHSPMLYPAQPRRRGKILSKGVTGCQRCWLSKSGVRRWHQTCRRWMDRTKLYGDGVDARVTVVASSMLAKLP